jgi:hypothetical protein
MAGDYGLRVSLPGTDVNTASGTDILLSSYPLFKLDTANPVSFQSLELTFNTEPPNPTPGNITLTEVYSAPHSYSYTPRCWLVWQNPSPIPYVEPAAGNQAAYRPQFGDEMGGNAFQVGLENGEILTGSIVSAVTYNDAGSIYNNLAQSVLIVRTDATNVSLLLYKDRAANFPAVTIEANIINVILNIRLYVFVDDMNV